MNKLIVVLILAGIQVCWSSGALAQTEACHRRARL